MSLSTYYLEYGRHVARLHRRRRRRRAYAPTSNTASHDNHEKITHGFPFVSHIWVAYGALLGGPSPELRYKKLVPVLSRLQWAIYSIDFYKFIYFSIFSLVLFLIETMYQTLKAAFHYISKNKNAPPHAVFSTLFPVFGYVVKHCGPVI